MAVEVRFKCNRSEYDHVKVSSNLGGKDVILTTELEGVVSEIYLDITTAIKLSKTLRTEINKVKEGCDD